MRDLVSIIIPAKNEEEIIKNTIKRIYNALKGKYDFEIIVLNDNSTDKTGKILNSLKKEIKRLKVIHRKPPSGFGVTIKQGIKNSKGDVIILVMADACEEPNDILKIIEKSFEKYDIVFGSRFTKHSKIKNYPFIKLILNRFINYLIKIMFNLSTNDITNAFKAYNGKKLRKIDITSKGFEINIEIPLKLIKKGAKYTQIPVNWYGRKTGVSKMNLLKHGKAYIKTIISLLK